MSDLRRLLEYLRYEQAPGRAAPPDKLQSALGLSPGRLAEAIRAARAVCALHDGDDNGAVRLNASVDWLDAAAVRGALQRRVPDGTVEVLMTVDSTSAHLSRHPGATGGRWHACLAEAQTAGRGRRGRRWHSPAGAGVWLSVRQEMAPGSPLRGLGIAVGVGLADAAAELGVRGAALKWPNDVQVRGLKLAGVLIETATNSGTGQTMTGIEAPAARRVVVGVGMNFRMPRSLRLDQPFTDLQSALNAAGAVLPSRNDVAACLIRHVVTSVALFERQGFAGFRQRFDAIDALRGRPVTIWDEGATAHGRALGVDDDGALLVETGAGVRTVTAGDVSVRARPVGAASATSAPEPAA